MEDNLPPLRALQVFEAVGYCGGISMAARRLGISPGAVSQQMKLLEDVLGVHLTHKEGNRLRLTTAGQKYHASCTVAFESLRVAYAEIKRSKNANNLSISALPSLLEKWLAPLVAAWQDEHPGLSVYLDGANAEPSPSTYEIDFRITYSEQTLGAENAIELFRDFVVPVCSPHLLRPDSPLTTPADILAYPLLTIDWLPKFAPPPSWRMWFESNGVASPQVNEGYRAFSISSVAIQAAIDGQGFVLGQCSMIARDVEAGRLIIPFPHPIPMPSSYFLMWSQSAFEKANGRNFHRWIITQGRERTKVTEMMLNATF